MYKNRRIVSILLIVVSWSYLIYKLCVFDDYNLLFSNLSRLPLHNYIYLAVILLLMPLNMFYEVYKWHISVNRVVRQSLGESLRQVMLGNAGAFITPYRIGEYPGRAYFLNDKSVFLTAVALGFVGTLALEIINVGFGLPASVFYFADSQPVAVFLSYAFILICAISLFLLLPKVGKWLKKRNYKDERSRNIIDTLCALDNRYLFNMLLYSLLRYMTYSVQLWLALSFFDIELTSLQALIAIPTYYMLVSVTPSLPIADAAIRGSWSIVVFQAYTTNTPAIAFAAVLLWLVNTVLPLLILPFIKKR